MIWKQPLGIVLSFLSICTVARAQEDSTVITQTSSVSLFSRTSTVGLNHNPWGQAWNLDEGFHLSSETSSATGIRTQKRQKPNMDGRAAAKPDAGDILIWVPRALLSPLHLVFEWGIRKPLGSLLTVAEKDNWANIIVDFLTFEDRKIGIIPTLFYDFNFRPSVGLYIFWNELFVEEHSVRLTAGFGGSDWYRVTVADRWQLGSKANLQFSYNLWARPDYIYGGLGVVGDPDNRSRYFSEFMDGTAELLVRPWRASEIRLEFGIRHTRFDGDGAADRGERTLNEALETGIFNSIPGGLDDYFSNFQRLMVQIDTRRPRPASGTGILIEPYLTHAWDMQRPELRQWVGYGGRIAGYLDIGAYKVFSLSGQVHGVDPVGDRNGDDIPFTEFFILGRRPQDLAGFLPGTLRGRSAAIATLSYTYPIWVFLDGALDVSVGNAFGPQLEDFSLERMRASIGIGFESNNDPDHALSFMLAVGTSEFNEAFAIDSLRLVVGTQTGF